jgi:hypothetical protein
VGVWGWGSRAAVGWDVGPGAGRGAGGAGAPIAVPAMLIEAVMSYLLLVDGAEGPHWRPAAWTWGAQHRVLRRHRRSRSAEPETARPGPRSGPAAGSLCG